MHLHHYHYSPALNAMVLISLLLFASTLAVIARDRLRERRRTKQEQQDRA